ncbi:hypothetical protein BH23THE1_BH23THE1_33880 [soil metagenome]
MSATLSVSESPTDLSGYYVIKKFWHGWLLGKVTNNESKFISRDKLIEMGYLIMSDNENNSDVLGTSPPALPTVIVVPTSPSNIRKRTHSLDQHVFNKKVPLKPKHRADNDLDWRKNKDNPT